MKNKSIKFNFWIKVNGNTPNTYERLKRYGGRSDALKSLASHCNRGNIGYLRNSDYATDVAADISVNHCYITLENSEKATIPKLLAMSKACELLDLNTEYAQDMLNRLTLSGNLDYDREAYVNLLSTSLASEYGITYTKEKPVKYNIGSEYEDVLLYVLGKFCMYKGSSSRLYINLEEV